MAIRARSIGELLDGAFRLYRQDLGLYMFTAIVASIPLAFFGVLTPAATAAEATAAEAVILLVTLPFAMIGTIVAWTALMHQMSERLDGREPTLGPSVRRGLRLIFRVGWAGILVYIIMVGATILGGVIVALSFGLVTFVSSLILPETAALVVTVIVVAVLSLAVFVLLGLRVLTGMALFLPGIVVENLTGYQSIKRGFALAKGGRSRILGVLFLSWILIFVPVVAAYFVTGTWRTIFDPAGVSSGVVGMGQLVVQQMLVLISAGFTTPFLVACILLLYFDQRVRLEAYDLQAEAEALAE